MDHKGAPQERNAGCETLPAFHYRGSLASTYIRSGAQIHCGNSAITPRKNHRMLPSLAILRPFRCPYSPHHTFLPDRVMIRELYGMAVRVTPVLRRE
jgi:hypothetical protein